MVLNSESFKSSDLMYTEYANKIVKSLDKDDDWTFGLSFISVTSTMFLSI